MNELLLDKRCLWKQKILTGKEQIQEAVNWRLLSWFCTPSWLSISDDWQGQNIGLAGSGSVRSFLSFYERIFQKWNWSKTLLSSWMFVLLITPGQRNTIRDHTGVSSQPLIQASKVRGWKSRKWCIDPVLGLGAFPALAFPAFPDNKNTRERSCTKPKGTRLLISCGGPP